MSDTMLPAAVTIPPGRRRAAVMLLAMGKSAAAKVLAELDEREAAALTKALLGLGAVPAEEIRASLVELAAGMGKLADVSAPQVDWISEVLTEAVGFEQARKMVEEATRPEPFAWLASADVDALTTVLEAESPSTTAIVLSYLDPDLGAKLLRGLTPEHQNRVAARVSELEGVSEQVLRGIDAALLEQVGKVMSRPTRPIDGVGQLATILGKVPRRNSDTVLDALRAEDPRRAAKVAEQMFTFNDVLELAARDLQKVLSSVEMSVLAEALHGATESEVESVFGNLTERAAANLSEELELSGPKRASQVRAARREVVSVAVSMEAAGDIVRVGLVEDDDDEVVPNPADEATPGEAALDAAAEQGADAMGDDRE